MFWGEFFVYVDIIKMARDRGSVLLCIMNIFVSFVEFFSVYFVFSNSD